MKSIMCKNCGNQFEINKVVLIQRRKSDPKWYEASDQNFMKKCPICGVKLLYRKQTMIGIIILILMSSILFIVDSILLIFLNVFFIVFGIIYLYGTFDYDVAKKGDV